MKKSNRPPFETSVKALVDGLGISLVEAIHAVDEYYKGFKAHSTQLIYRQDDSANNAAINLINQCTLTATAVLTFASAFIGVVYENISLEQTILFIVIVIFELAGLTLSLFEYSRAISFHNKWAKAYHNADREIEDMLSSGVLRETRQLGEVQARYTRDLNRETSKMWHWILISFTTLGAWLFLLLVTTYFFDVPFYNSHLL